MSTLQEYRAGFTEETGYLDFAGFGPVSRAVVAESDAQADLLVRGRHGAFERLRSSGERMPTAVARLTGFRADQVAFQPSTTQGIAQAIFGVAGGILVSRAEYPSLTAASVRASESLKATAPLWLETEHGRVTPGTIREQLTTTTTAVAVSLVDSRTGYVADIDGIRQVIGERVLIVDAAQGFGVVDAPWQAADVIVATGQKWLRAGFGAGFMVVSDRAANRLTHVFSGPGGFPDGELVFDAVPEPAEGAAGFQLGSPDWVACARLAAAAEEIADVGVRLVADAARDNAARVIALADTHGLNVVSPRSDAERAGIVVVEPPEQHFTALTAAFVNHGISVTSRQGRIRLSPHAGTTRETLDLLKSALLAYSSVARPVRASGR